MKTGPRAECPLRRREGEVPVVWWTDHTRGWRWRAEAPVVVERAGSTWNVHLYVTKKCGKVRFLRISFGRVSIIVRFGCFSAGSLERMALATFVRGTGRQFSRFVCGLRAGLRQSGRRLRRGVFTARLKPCPFGSVVGIGDGRGIAHPCAMRLRMNGAPGCGDSGMDGPPAHPPAPIGHLLCVDPVPPSASITGRA